MLRVLLVESDPERAAAVEAGLSATGCTVVAIASGTRDLTRHVRDTGAEVIVCGLDDPSRDELEGMRALHRDEPRPVILFAEKAEAEQIEEALAAGVSAYVVEGMAPARLRPVIEVAIRRFRAHQALRKEPAEALRTSRSASWSTAPRPCCCSATASPSPRPIVASAAWRWIAASTPPP